MRICRRRRTPGKRPSCRTSGRVRSAPRRHQPRPSARRSARRSTPRSRLRARPARRPYPPGPRALQPSRAKRGKPCQGPPDTGASQTGRCSAPERHPHRRRLARPPPAKRNASRRSHGPRRSPRRSAAPGHRHRRRAGRRPTHPPLPVEGDREAERLRDPPGFEIGRRRAHWTALKGTTGAACAPPSCAAMVAPMASCASRTAAPACRT